MNPNGLPERSHGTFIIALPVKERAEGLVERLLRRELLDALPDESQRTRLVLDNLRQQRMGGAWVGGGWRDGCWVGVRLVGLEFGVAVRGQ